MSKKENKKDMTMPPLGSADAANIESRLVDTEPVINIPEDEIWTYQVPGLAAPHIGKPLKMQKLREFSLHL